MRRVMIANSGEYSIFAIGAYFRQEVNIKMFIFYVIKAKSEAQTAAKCHSALTVMTMASSWQSNISVCYDAILR